MKPPDPATLIPELERRLAPRPEILEAYLFGSSAAGRAGPVSDVDVAVYLDAAPGAEPPFGYAATLAADLATALGGVPVDVVVLNHAPPLLYQRVLRDGRRLVSRDLMSTTTREGAALSRYCDYLPQLRKIDDAQAARIARGDFGR